MSALLVVALTLAALAAIVAGLRAALGGDGQDGTLFGPLNARAAQSDAERALAAARAEVDALDPVTLRDAQEPVEALPEGCVPYSEPAYVAGRIEPFFHREPVRRERVVHVPHLAFAGEEHEVRELGSDVVHLIRAPHLVPVAYHDLATAVALETDEQIRYAEVRAQHTRVTIVTDRFVDVLRWRTCS